jgi:hypothetical protein
MLGGSVRIVDFVSSALPASVSSNGFEGQKRARANLGRNRKTVWAQLVVKGKKLARITLKPLPRVRRDDHGKPHEIVSFSCKSPDLRSNEEMRASSFSCEPMRIRV